ncbi:SpoIID/LytB domain-containing protein [Priestia megaterium]|nr:SpoIID/LytB domain-containing protein [Priestia megaterium]
MKKIVSILLLVSLVVSGLSLNYAQAATEPTEPVMKVKLVNYLKNQTEITVKTAVDADTSDDQVTFKGNQTYHLKVEQGKLSVYEGSTKLNSYDSFKLYTSQTDETWINGRSYFGAFKFEVEGTRYVRPTNYILLETYLKGVVPNEMYASWPVEALKAQAVAARAYAMSYAGKVVNDTTQYQVYGGNTPHTNSNAAVEQTYGKALTYNGKLLNAVYSSSNGGKIESNVNAWPGGANVPYYQVKDDPYDIKTKWDISFATEQIDLSGKDPANVDVWWNATTEKDAKVTGNIKAWLQKNGYQDKDIKVTGIPALSFYETTSGGRVSKGNFVAEFIVKDDIHNKTERLDGPTRYETTVAISKKGWNTADTVVIANGENFPDALAGAPLAAQQGAPLLLTPADKLKPVVKEEIKRLKATKAIILGAPIVVSKGIENELKSIGITQIERIGGKDRFETAAKIAQRLNSNSTKVVITNGLNFPDALSVAPYAAKNEIPILLTRADSLPKPTADIVANKTEAIVIGSPVVVNEQVFSQLPNPKRYAGPARYETNTEVVKQLKMGTDKAYVAAGTNFPDALSGSVLAAKNNAPILLTDLSDLPNPLNDVKKNYKEFTILGSSSVVSQSIEQQLTWLENTKYLTKTDVKSSDIRPILGSTYMLSYLVTNQTVKDGRITISGLGNGHGVGMSQYGAKKMADLGKTYLNILDFYYPTTKVLSQYNSTPSLDTEALKAIMN